LTVGPMPTFLIDIDGPQAQLRASVGFDQPLVESSFEPHVRRLHFSNPYKTMISGTVKLKAPPGWTLNPPTFTFSLNPGETFDRELTVSFPYNSFAGPKTVNCEFLLQDAGNTSFNVPTTLKLGLSDVGMESLAFRDGKDIVVQQMISNYGDKPIDYTAFALFPGQARQERLVTHLGPGHTVIKQYRFKDATLSAKTKVRIGLKELMGVRVLNDEIAVQ
jgi:NPCBM-associated, NEW3 domain of alpha-galactosidase